MGTPTTTQRIDTVEEQIGNIQSTIRAAVIEEVSAAIKGAVTAMETALSNRFTMVVEETVKKQERYMEEISIRLEGRINRSREHQESMLSMVKNDQLLLQAELRAAIQELVGKGKDGPTQSEVVFNSGCSKVSELRLGEGDRYGKGVVMGEHSHTGQGSGGGPGGSLSMGLPLAGGGANWRFKKLDMPLFDGENPDGWILRAERYHHFYRLTEEDKLEAAVVALEGDALLWFQWENRWRPIQNWEEMKTMMRRQFRSTATETLHEQWLSHKQSETVCEYRRKFIELLAPLERIPEEIAKGQFLNGLKEEIKVEVRLLGPKNLDNAMDLALMVEDKLRVGASKKSEQRGGHSVFNRGSYTPSNVTVPSRGNFSNSTTGSVSPTSYSQASSATSSPGGNRSFISGKSGGEVRRLSDAEMQVKRAKGLCYRCDDKWSIGHKCKRKELSVLLTCEGEEEEQMTSPQSQFSEELIEVRPNSPQPEISLNSVMGLTSPRTMKLMGKIGNQKVVVMVDPGATHNFISREAVEKLGVPVLPSQDFGVSLGTGDSVVGTGICRSVVLEVQGVVIVENFLPLDLGNSDLILGIQWLEKICLWSVMLC